ncbi:hypothetical protein GC207_00545 [bacterium]|nr:hypothetical protein [bacterium]
MKPRIADRLAGFEADEQSSFPKIHAANQNSMNANQLNPEQRRALLELLVFGMYSDGHLSIEEDLRVHAFLQECGIKEDFARRALLQNAISALRKIPNRSNARKHHVAQIAAPFDNAHVAQFAVHKLEELLTVDGQLSDRESDHLQEVRQLLNC